MTYEQDNRISGSSRSSKRSKLFAGQNLFISESRPDCSRGRQFSGIYNTLEYMQQCINYNKKHQIFFIAEYNKIEERQ